MSESHDRTNRMIQKLEARIQRLYNQQADKLNGMVTDYLEPLEGSVMALQKQFDDDGITAQQMKQSLHLTVTNTRKFKDLTAQVAEHIVETTEEAFDYMAETGREVFRVNYEEERDEAERDFPGREAIVTALAAVVIPKINSTLDRKKDYRYHAYNFRAAVTTSVLTISPELPPRLGYLTGKKRAEAKAESYMNTVASKAVGSTLKKAINSARSIARTKMTYWENRGRQTVFNILYRLGVSSEKVWCTQMDERVREAHEFMEGVHVPMNEPFICQGYEMEFPGDPSGGAPSELWYNCRCYEKRYK